MTCAYQQTCAAGAHLDKSWYFVAPWRSMVHGSALISTSLRSLLLAVYQDCCSWLHGVLEIVFPGLLGRWYVYCTMPCLLLLPPSGRVADECTFNNRFGWFPNPLLYDTNNLESP
jgi:hypothetical protein